MPQGWDDAEVQLPPGVQPFAGSAVFPGESEKAQTARRKKWRWPWQKEKQLVGERMITLNNAAMNADYPSNFVSTSKYNMVTFVPKFLTGEHNKSLGHMANFSISTRAILKIREYFLLIHRLHPTNTGCIADEQVDDYCTPRSSVTRVCIQRSSRRPCKSSLSWSCVSPNLITLIQKRHQSDSELNARKAKVLTPQSTFAEKKWKDIHVGDVVRVESDDFIPADMILISSSEPEGLCYIETSNLDGETNLKIKQASHSTASLTSPNLVTSLHGSLRSEQPNNSLYTYEGTMDLVAAGGVPKHVPLGPDQLLLRGAQIRNTPWVYGIVVFTGHETKLMRNATAAPIKRTAVERQVNVQIVFLFMLLLALSLGSTVGSSIRTASILCWKNCPIADCVVICSGSSQASSGICLRHPH